MPFRRLVVPYERLIEAPPTTLEEVIFFSDPGRVLDRGRLMEVVGGGGIENRRDVASFRYYDLGTFRLAEEGVRSELEALGIPRLRGI